MEKEIQMKIKMKIQIQLKVKSNPIISIEEYS